MAGYRPAQPHRSHEVQVLPNDGSAARAARTVAGILLTGGHSSRLGIDKASLVTPTGETLAARTARLLRGATHPAVEVGPGFTDLPSVAEGNRRGPLGAIVAGVHRLDDMVGRVPTLVVATDLPGLRSRTLRVLTGFPGDRSVVPSVGGVLQVLCSRYSPSFLTAAVDAFARGQRSLIKLVEQSEVDIITESEWEDDAASGAFADVDTPEDLRRMVELGALVEPPLEGLG